MRVLPLVIALSAVQPCLTATCCFFKWGSASDCGSYVGPGGECSDNPSKTCNSNNDCPAAPASPLSGSPSKYNKVQLLPFQLWSAPTYVGFPDEAYPGLPDDVADIEARVSFLKDVIGNASADKRIDTSQQTLKIFMAPEFMYRGVRGAYHIDKLLGRDNTTSDGLFDKLAGLVLDTRLSDWLFVFGTAVGYDPLHDDPNNKSALIYNVALIQKGGLKSQAAAASQAVLVKKRTLSHVDFLERPKVGFNESGVRVNKEPPYVKHLRAPGMKVWPVDETGIFRIDNITFGLEICLDHLRGRLANTRQNASDFIPQVYLLTSEGSDIAQGLVPLQPDGIFLHVDGYHAVGRSLGGGSLAGIMGKRILSSVGRVQPTWDSKRIKHLYGFSMPAPHVDIYEAVPLPLPQRSTPACKYNEFMCKSNLQCLSAEHRCDGVRDCDDGSDEHSCPKCMDMQRGCNSTMCDWKGWANCCVCGGGNRSFQSGYEAIVEYDIKMRGDCFRFWGSSLFKSFSGVEAPGACQQRCASEALCTSFAFRWSPDVESGVCDLFEGSPPLEPLHFDGPNYTSVYTGGVISTSQVYTSVCYSKSSSKSLLISRLPSPTYAAPHNVQTLLV